MNKNATKLFLDKSDWNIITTNEDVVTKVTKNKYWQTKTLFCRTYMTLDDLAEFLRDTNAIAWAYIVHDKDVNVDGTLKQPHLHFVAKWEDGIRLSYLGKHTRGQQTHVDVCKHGTKASVAYLTHKNQPNKHQYDDADVVSFNIDVLLETKKQRKEKDNECFLDDLSALSMRHLAKKYGRDYMRNYERYRNFVCEMNEDDYLRELRELESDINDTKLFTLYGVDYSTYTREFNLRFIEYFIDKLNSLDCECINYQFMLSAFIDFARIQRTERESYIRAHKGEVF